MFSCRIERDSINTTGDRLISYVVQYPRTVIAEQRTHRRNYISNDSWEEVSWDQWSTTEDISKNSASTRAIPTKKMLESVSKDPYIPKWTLNQKGMQGEYISDDLKIAEANNVCLEMLNTIIEGVEQLEYLGIHKQDAGRYIEPWSWTTQILTSSRWDNFFALRCHKDAYPPFRTIARMMFLARRKSTPVKLEYGQWHLPFVPLEQQMNFDWKPDLFEDEHFELPDLIKYSVARTAWMSYESSDKDGSHEKMIATYDRLMKEPPFHVSPCEAQATPFCRDIKEYVEQYRSNLTGWLQCRKLIKHEEIKEYNPSEEEIKSWGLPDESL